MRAGEVGRPGAPRPSSRMIDVRQLDDTELAVASAIDVSEEGDVVYRIVAGELHAVHEAWRRPRWDAAAWAEVIRSWRRLLLPDVWLGAFADGALVGLASVRHRLTPSTAQLTTLHVDRAHRRQGVAGRLLAAVVEQAEEHGAAQLYVSSAPSASAVGFYRRHGFELTPDADPRLLALEPDDIHMLLRLGGAADPRQS